MDYAGRIVLALGAMGLAMMVLICLLTYRANRFETCVKFKTEALQAHCLAAQQP